jgi:hypothetical protein
MEFKTINIVEMIFLGFTLILFLLFFVTIKRNSDNIFFSMRSSNLMLITNILIFLSIIVYVLLDIFYDDYQDLNGVKYLSTFYSVLQISLFCSLASRYFRLYLSCKNYDNSGVQYGLFVPKSYHYEYFYVRVIGGITFLVLIFATIIYFIINNNTTMFIYEIQFINGDNSEGFYYFWIILTFIETVIFMTFYLLIIRTHLNPDVHITSEIALVSLINYIYSLSFALSFFIKEENEEATKYVIQIIPIIYNLSIYFVVIALPFLYGVFNTTVIIYDLPGELCSSLYLFLTKEKCFDAFYNYLSLENDREKGTFFLNLLISIFKFRLLVTNNESRELIREELDEIRLIYLDRIGLYYKDFEAEKESQEKEDIIATAINLCENARRADNIKPNIFDKIAGIVYSYLDEKFKDFKNTGGFNDLKDELTEETNIRCKLTNFGLIRN